MQVHDQQQAKDLLRNQSDLPTTCQNRAYTISPKSAFNRTFASVKILTRYVLAELITYFVISVLAFTGLLLTLRMLRFAALIVNRGVEFSQIVHIFVAIVPTFLEIAIPLATLLGVMLAFARLSGDSEIIVTRASGISLYQFLIPVLIFSSVVTAGGMYVSTVLRPWGFRELSEGLFDIARSKSTSGLSEGVFNKLGDIVLYADTIDYATGSLSKVVVDDKRETASRKIVIAERGRILSDDSQQTLSLILEDGVVHEELEGNYVLTNFNTNSILVSPAELFKNEAARGARPREMDFARLRTQIETFRSVIRGVAVDPLEQDSRPEELKGLSAAELNRRYRRAKVELGQRFSMPIAAFVMSFVGMALGIMPPRAQKTWGAGLSATFGLVVFVVYYGIFSMGLALAESGQMKIWIALWLPNILCALAAGYLLKKLASEEWQSIADLFTNFPRRVAFWRRKA